MSTQPVKQCRVCLRVLPVDQFFVRSDNGQRVNRCKACERDWYRAWFAANRERELERRKAAERARRLKRKCVLSIVAYYSGKP